MPAVMVPSATLLTYRFSRWSDNFDLGSLQGVLNEPTFVMSINKGCGELQLLLDHFPAELSFGCLIQVQYPDGTSAGLWRYEGRVSDLVDKSQYQITCMPIVSELTDIDFTANYSSDTTQQTSALGAAKFSVPVNAALALAKYCSADATGGIHDDGNTYNYVFSNGQCVQTLDQAVMFGGTGWYWYADRNGKTTLSSTYYPGALHVLTVGREITGGTWTDEITTLYNAQPVVGGQPAAATKALRSFKQDTSAANPFSTVNIGVRTAPTYQDPALLDQASCDQMATALLNSHERITSRQALKVRGYIPPAGVPHRPQPGDAVLIRERVLIGTGGQAAGTTSIASGSDNVNLSSHPSTVYVQSTTGFPASGTFSLPHIGGRCSYTGVTAGSFTGITVLLPGNDEMDQGDSVVGVAIPSSTAQEDPIGTSGDFIENGPFLILDVTEYGATNCYDLNIASDLVVSHFWRMPRMHHETAVNKLRQIPARTAISPDGHTTTPIVSTSTIATTGVTSSGAVSATTVTASAAGTNITGKVIKASDLISDGTAQTGYCAFSSPSGQAGAYWATGVQFRLRFSVSAPTSISFPTQHKNQNVYKIYAEGIDGYGFTLVVQQTAAGAVAWEGNYLTNGGS